MRKSEEAELMSRLFTVSGTTYLRLVNVLGLDTDVDCRRKYEVELVKINNEAELTKSLDNFENQTEETKQ